MSTSSTQQGVVVFAKDKKRVSAFYEQTLGLVAEEFETTPSTASSAG